MALVGAQAVAEEATGLAELLIPWTLLPQPLAQVVPLVLPKGTAVQPELAVQPEACVPLVLPKGTAVQPELAVQPEAGVPLEVAFRPVLALEALALVLTPL